MIARERLLNIGCLLVLVSVLVLVHWYITRFAPNPRYGKIFYRTGVECEKKCAANERIYYFKRAVFYDPNLSDAYYQLGAIYEQEGRHKEAIEAYKQAVQLDYTNGEAYFKVGLSCFQKGEFDRAIRYFLQSDRRKPSAHDTFYYLAKAYDRKGMYLEATYYYVTLLIWGSPRSAEICERIWSISKIPDQFQMVTTQLMMLWNANQHELWKEIDRYIKTDQEPEFLRKPAVTGTRLN